MDAREAREHLEMVDRILSKAERKPLRPWPALLLTFGIGAALLDAGQQWAAAGHGPAMNWAGAVVLLAGYAYAIVGFAAERRRCNVNADEAFRGRMVGAVWVCIVIAAFAGGKVLPGWSGAAIWTIGAAIQMAIVGFTGDRRGLFGAVALLGSLIVANYTTLPTGYVLAAGFIAGYCLPGVFYALERVPE